MILCTMEILNITFVNWYLVLYAIDKDLKVREGNSFAMTFESGMIMDEQYLLYEMLAISHRHLMVFQIQQEVQVEYTC